MKGLIFTYGMTAAGAICGLFWPFYGLLAYVSFAIIKPDAMWPWSVPPARYSLLIAGGMLIGWVFTKQATFRMGRAIVPMALITGYLGWSYFGAFFPQHQDLAWDFVERMVKIIIPMLIGLTLITSTKHLKQLAWTILLAQGYVAFELNSYYFSGYNVLRWEGFGGMDNNSAAIALVTGLGLAFFLGVHSEKTWQKGLAFGMAVLMANAIMFSFSRGGMLGLIVAGGASILVIPKRPRTYATIGLALIGASILAGPEVRERFMTTFVKKEGQREASAQSRVDLWMDCVDVMKKRPVMGCGPNHWPMIASQYGWPHGKEAHSLWMQTGAELGLVGLALYLGFYLTCLALLWHLTWKRTHVADPWYKHIARMSFVGLAGFVASAQFVSLESLEIPYYTAMLGCGVLKLASTSRVMSEDELNGLLQVEVGGALNDELADEFDGEIDDFDADHYLDSENGFEAYPELTPTGAAELSSDSHSTANTD
ncbi:MAG: O-antigen ligase family protein [Planctomycetota bacterium]|nr:O-antigen ligase family protein [Planctomycetota bacterium]